MCFPAGNAWHLPYLLGISPPAIGQTLAPDKPARAAPSRTWNSKPSSRMPLAGICATAGRYPCPEQEGSGAAEPAAYFTLTPGINRYDASCCRLGTGDPKWEQERDAGGGSDLQVSPLESRTSSGGMVSEHRSCRNGGDNLLSLLARQGWARPTYAGSAATPVPGGRRGGRASLVFEASSVEERDAIVREVDELAQRALASNHGGDLPPA